MPSDTRIPRRALVVDDEQDICRQFREALEEEGWEVETAGDGEEAIRAVERFVPTVVVLDLRMPKTDGLMVQARIRENRPWTPVLIVTGHGEEDDAVECVNQHAFRFLRKPVSPLTIVEACEQSLETYPAEVVAFFAWFAALQDPNRVIYQTVSGTKTSAQELKDHVQRQTPEGREFIRQVAGVAVELITTRL